MTAVLADDPSLIERLLDHIDHKTTHLADGIWREPVEHYTSPARFAAEIELVFRRTPTPFCPSAALPEVGSYVARQAGLTPIVVVRGTDGVARAFRNACRHRGVQVADGSGCRKALTCRYHGWTYGLDGRLRGIPDEHGFPDLEKNEYGLVPVAAVERCGMIFVAQDRPGNDDADIKAVPQLFGANLRLLASTEQDYDANWKIVAEGFLEGYHIRSTHHETFYPRQYDNINVIETFERNSRISFPYRAIEKLRGVARADRKATGVLTQVYHLFPNVMVATFPTNMVMVVLEPLTVERTRLINYTLSDIAEHAEGRAKVDQGRDFVAAGAAEDREMACSAQRGLASRANEVLTFGLFEGAIGHFHRNLDAAIEG